MQTDKKTFLKLTGYQWTWILYIAVAVFSWQIKYLRHIDNNYLIFREAFYHLKGQLNMYAAYPKQYYDFYYYGPLFGLFVAPFALPSALIGLFLWEVAGAVALLAAINILPLSEKRKTILLLLCAIEFSNAVFSMQFNPMIAAIIIVSFILVERGKDAWATFFIVLGALMKLYPIVGLTFILFSKNKPKFLVWAAVWFVILLIVPVAISSPTFVINSYHQWFAALNFKNELNHQLATRSQDICIMGVVRDFAQTPNVPDLPFLIFGAVVFVLPLLRFSQYKSYKFRLQILATALIMVVIFSTGAESPTYIIAVVGVFLWMLMQEKSFTRVNIVLIVLLLVITGLGLTDAMPQPFRGEIIGKYGMKAWPCIIAWFIISYELLFKDFMTPASLDAEKKILVID
ncbi:glycosyltransferase family 87 protein [Mucilaginibacter sp. X5P1]|uniref:glycosyltransferase family 87 protein n=1 Tax=Mucilaginibacter sp. X5P1 TaxID=2723088 RepID=UPI00160C78FE|nr:glycosyltransferase family 87 protein [Mucilaginibacter sp. X5P1]MBB6137734.1 hypothetical protein [Mucilaginibacter sp. X5P1]